MQNLNKLWPCCFKSDMKNWLNFHYSTEKFEKLYNDWLFSPKAYVSARKFQELCAMTLRGDAKFKGKLTCGLKNSIMNLVNFHASSRKSENVHLDWLLMSKAYRAMQRMKKNWLLVPKMTGIRWIKSESLHFDVLLLSVAYKFSAKKVQKNDLSWHWRVIQTLKKNWLFVWKMTWGIWWILTWVEESLKINTLMGYFCRKYVMLKLKKNPVELCLEKWPMVSKMAWWICWIFR